MTDYIYNPKKLTKELQAENLPVAGVSSKGRVDYSRALTKQEKSAADVIIAAHDCSPEDDQVQKDLFAAKGISDHAILMALWNKIVNSDSKDAERLLERMGEV